MFPASAACAVVLRIPVAMSAGMLARVKRFSTKRSVVLDAPGKIWLLTIVEVDSGVWSFCCGLLTEEPPPPFLMGAAKLGATRVGWVVVVMFVLFFGLFRVTELVTPL